MMVGGIKRTETGTGEEEDSEKRSLLIMWVTGAYLSEKSPFFAAILKRLIDESMQRNVRFTI